MKILLDIDGVMIPARPWQSYDLGPDGFGVFNKLAVSNLNKIISSCQITEIVLTTSHKHSFSLKKWHEIFAFRGVLPAALSRLDSDSSTMSRKDEIFKWYVKNLNESFIVIDDDKGLNALDLDFKEKHLVLTAPTIGLNRLAADHALLKIKTLNEMLTS
jgi:hypothetical protein